MLTNLTIIFCLSISYSFQGNSQTRKILVKNHLERARTQIRSRLKIVAICWIICRSSLIIFAICNGYRSTYNSFKIRARTIQIGRNCNLKREIRINWRFCRLVILVYLILLMNFCKFNFRLSIKTNSDVRQKRKQKS